MLSCHAEPQPSTDIFRELSDNFRELSELLYGVGEALHASSAGTSPAATVSLYERWLKTGSTTVADALCERGVMPIRRTDVLH
jgi:hypothetical protein